jgi:hypothetical protein
MLHISVVCVTIVNIEVLIMNWIIFSYSLPAQASSGPRVTLWRRLRRLGAISPTGGIYILPAQDMCVEAFQWLAQEIKQANGQAMVMSVQQLEGLTDQQLIDLFREARQEDYAELKMQVTNLEQTITVEKNTEKFVDFREALTKLQKQYSDIRQIDYFDSPDGVQLAAQLAKIAKTLAPVVEPSPQIAQVSIESYRDRVWGTRPKPHVDRLACAWLIRRFINAEATIRYAHQPIAAEVTFDMSEAEFSHTGNLCTFETMIQAFDLDTPGLSLLAEIVHEIDLQDERYFHPEITGVEAILKGWLQLDLPDTELEKYGIALFEGLISELSTRS